MPAPARKINWEKIPWHKLSNATIAERYQCSRVTVWIKRARYAPDTCRNPLASTKFGKANWKLRDEEIAAKLGVSVATVAKRRAQAGAPPQPRKLVNNSGRKPTIKAPYDPLLSTKENAKRMGVGADAVRYHRLKLEAKAGAKPASKKPASKPATPAAKKPEAKKLTAPAPKKVSKPAKKASEKPAAPKAKKKPKAGTAPAAEGILAGI